MSHTHALVLGAGAARRFGGGKLVAPWRGRRLIDWSVAAAIDSGLDAVTVVLGCDAAAIRSGLDPAVRTIECADWAEGIAASLRCGIAALPSDTLAVLIFLGDMPEVSGALGRRMLDAVRGGASAALADVDGIPAHPVAVGAAALPLLGALHGDTGARSALAGLAGVRRFAAEQGAIFDIDEVADLARDPRPSGVS